MSKARTKNGKLYVEKVFNLEYDIDLRDTNITSLPDGLSVKGEIFIH